MIKRSESEWQALFEQHRSSGQSAAEFCRQHQLCSKYFSLRKKQLQIVDKVARSATKQIKSSQASINKRIESQSSKKGFIPALITAHSSVGVVIEYEAFRLQCPTSIDAHWLATLMRGLQA